MIQRFQPKGHICSLSFALYICLHRCLSLLSVSLSLYLSTEDALFSFCQHTSERIYHLFGINTCRKSAGVLFPKKKPPKKLTGEHKIKKRINASYFCWSYLVNKFLLTHLGPVLSLRSTIFQNCQWSTQ